MTSPVRIERQKMGILKQKLTCPRIFQDAFPLLDYEFSLYFYLYTHPLYTINSEMYATFMEFVITILCRLPNQLHIKSLSLQNYKPKLSVIKHLSKIMNIKLS